MICRAGRNDDLLREISGVRATLIVKIDFGAGEERRFVKINFGRRMKMAFGRAGRNDDLLKEISGVRATLFVKIGFGDGGGTTIC